jgi:hypothetical protein
MKLTEKQIIALIKLTNPELHGQSELSVRATAFLQTGLTGNRAAPAARKRVTRKLSKRVSTYATAPATPSVEIVDDDVPW